MLPFFRTRLRPTPKPSPACLRHAYDSFGAGSGIVLKRQQGKYTKNQKNKLKVCCLELGTLRHSSKPSPACLRHAYDSFPELTPHLPNSISSRENIRRTKKQTKSVPSAGLLLGCFSFFPIITRPPLACKGQGNKKILPLFQRDKFFLLCYAPLTSVPGEFLARKKEKATCTTTCGFFSSFWETIAGGKFMNYLK